ncbi:MAG: hypothetical protein KDA32_01140 [Phycisphaerales bacterium]|nr:hypothetical protein [Phycisphaerales bacterium]
MAPTVNRRALSAAALILAAGLVASTQAQPVTARNPLTPPLFTIDANSPTTLGVIDPADVLRVPGPTIVIDNLGLFLLFSPPDEVDGISLPMPPEPNEPFAFVFAVNRNSTGAVAPDATLTSMGFPFNVQDQATKGHAAGDAFMSLTLFTLAGGAIPTARSLSANNTLVISQGDAGGVDFYLTPPTSPTTSFVGTIDGLSGFAGVSGSIAPPTAMWAPRGDCNNCPPPINDDPPGAIFVDCGSDVLSTNSGATLSPSEPGFSCAGPYFNTVWYRFLAFETTAQVSTCGSQASTILDVFDPNTMDELACDVDGCGDGHAVACVSGLIPGREYLIRVASPTPASSGAVTISVQCPCPTGACCLPDDTCFDSVNRTQCEDPNGLGGIYLGDATTCFQAECPPFEVTGIFFTVTRTSPSLAFLPGTNSGADIYFDNDPRSPGGETLFAQPGVLGLTAFDDIDGMVVLSAPLSTRGPGPVYNPMTDRVLFTLDGNSPSGTPGNIYITTPGGGFMLFASAATLGLSASDDIEALDVIACSDVIECVENWAIGDVCDSPAPGPDCDGDGRLDRCQILFDGEPDVNGNLIPDICECLGDMDGDGMITLSDLAGFLGVFGECAGSEDYNPLADLDADGCIDLGDLAGFLARFGQTCP